MKKKISKTCLAMILVFLQIHIAAAAERAPVETDFGPVYYMQDGNTVDYKKTQCQVGLRFFISEKSTEYEEFMKDHFSNPDSSSNLLDKAVGKFNAYRNLLFDEFFKYKAKSGAFSASQFEFLEKCYTLIKNEVDLRQKNLKENFRAGAADRKTARLNAKYQSINDKFKDKIHFPYAQFLGRMKSFSDGLPCFTNKCVK